MDRVSKVLDALGAGSGAEGSSTAGLQELLNLVQGTLGAANHAPITIINGSNNNSIINNSNTNSNNNNANTAEPGAGPKKAPLFTVEELDLQEELLAQFNRAMADRMRPTGAQPVALLPPYYQPPMEASYVIEKSQSNQLRVNFDGNWIQLVNPAESGVAEMTEIAPGVPLVRLVMTLHRIVTTTYLESPACPAYVPADILRLVDVTNPVAATFALLNGLGMLLIEGPVTEGREVLIKGRRFRVAGARLWAVE